MSAIEHNYTVEGMSCEHCRAAVIGAVAQLPGVTAVEVDLDEGRATVRGGTFDDGAIRAAVADAGYELIAR